MRKSEKVGNQEKQEIGEKGNWKNQEIGKSHKSNNVGNLKKVIKKNQEIKKSRKSEKL